MKVIQKNKLIKLIILTTLIILISMISIYLQKIDIDDIKINNKELKNEKGKISVYISGAVNYPGVYSFNEGIILSDALSLIGGVKEDADITKLNLAKMLLDSEKIVIPYVQKEVIEMDNIGDQAQENSEKININSASKEELITLPGIGDATAEKIIEYRKNGNFETIEDIKKVPGIGNSKYEKIKDKITI